MILKDPGSFSQESDIEGERWVKKQKKVSEGNGTCKGWEPKGDIVLES